MPTLTSPGVSVFVNDQSIYSEPTPTTIPLIVFATRKNKKNSSGITAIGTTEANKFRQISSQRELLQYYGNPVFVSSKGEPVHGHETNEYGLFATWSFLAGSNRAYVIRADVDTGQLVPSKSEPTLPPPDGTHWMKKNDVVGGIFKYNGSNWIAVPFKVYTTTPTNADGVNGDFAFDYSTLNGRIMFKDGGSWKAATNTNLVTAYGATSNIVAQGTSPLSPTLNQIWYKTTSSVGGSNLKLTKFRAVDNAWVTMPIVRQSVVPVPNNGTIWEDLTNIATTGNRPLYIGTGVSFIALPVIIQDVSPVTEPEAGTLWYDDTLTDFALYLEGTDLGRGNEWVPILTTTVLNPTATEKVISASAPQFPNEGAIWVDVSSPEKLDNYPVIKRWQGAQWIDITDSVLITDVDPNASVVVNGTYWLNIGEAKTRNTVKLYDRTYQAVTVKNVLGVYQVVAEANNYWRPNSGSLFGRRAVRDIIVEKMQAAFNTNEDARDDSTYYQLMACPGYPELYDEMNTLNADQEEVSFVVADTPKYMIPSGIPSGREVTAREWVTNANNVAATGERGFASAGSPYAGFWYPWGITSNLDGEDVFVPPSHMALRVLSYSDSVAAPWFPPAGFTRGRVINASSVGYLNNNDVYTPIRLHRKQRDILYENKLNPFAFIPNRGLTAFGQKTFSPISSAMDRINVARLVAKMKYDLRRLLEPFLFEINDAITRRSAKIVTERYLSGLKALRALYDYGVRCDENNNTGERIDRNELWVDVFIKPARSIEFIYVPITLLNTGDQIPV